MYLRVYDSRDSSHHWVASLHPPPPYTTHSHIHTQHSPHPLSSRSHAVRYFGFLSVWSGLQFPDAWPLGLGLLYVYIHTVSLRKPSPGGHWVATWQCMWDVLDPPGSVFSLSLYRHPSIYILFSYRFTSCNKQQLRVYVVEYDGSGDFGVVSPTNASEVAQADPPINGQLNYPNDLDRSLNETVTDKIRAYLGMPHRTARAPHVRLCGQLTALPSTARAVDKFRKQKFRPFCPPFRERESLSHSLSL